MKFNIHFTTPPHVIFTLFLAISLLTGCMTEADSGSNGDNGQVTNPAENPSDSGNGGGANTNPTESKATYTITFDANGGSGAMNPQIFTYGEPQNLSPNEFTMENKDFLGWAKTSGGSIAYDDNSRYTIGTADVTLYAVWGKLVTADNAATVIAGLEGGTRENPNVCTVKITSKELTDENILKEISKKIDSVFANPSYIHINLDLSAVEITEISESAFASAKLTGITLPNSLKSIEKNAFGATYHLKKIVIPDNVETIKTEAFIGSWLTEITLPASLSSIEEGAFFECDKLETVYYKGPQAQWEILKTNISTTDNDKLTGANIICSDGIINGE